MVYIAYCTELNLQVCNYAQKRWICRKNSQHAPDENFYDHFCSCRKAANFCHPAPPPHRGKQLDFQRGGSKFILQDLFRDTLLDHIWRAQIRNQLCQIWPNMANGHIWHNDPKKHDITHGGPQLTSCDPKNVMLLTGGPY